MLSPPPPLMCLLCACSDLISSLHRQGKAIDRIKTRVISVGIAIAKISPQPKGSNTQPRKAANTIQKSAWNLISPLLIQKHPERSPQWNLPAPICMDLPPQTISGRPKTPHSYYPPLQSPYLSSGPSTTGHQWQAQNSTQSTHTLPTSILISSILPSCPTKISSVLSWMLSITLQHWGPVPTDTRFTQESSKTS